MFFLEFRNMKKSGSYVPLSAKEIIDIYKKTKEESYFIETGFYDIECLYIPLDIYPNDCLQLMPKSISEYIKLKNFLKKEEEELKEKKFSNLEQKFKEFKKQLEDNKNA